MKYRIQFYLIGYKYEYFPRDEKYNAIYISLSCVDR